LRQILLLRLGLDGSERIWTKAFLGVSHPFPARYVILFISAPDSDPLFNISHVPKKFLTSPESCLFGDVAFPLYASIWCTGSGWWDHCI